LIEEYAHQKLNQEVTAIGGTYILVKEVLLPFRGREVLCVVGHAAFDTTCCGPGGCGHAFVPGFLIHWKGKVNEDGLAVSDVEPVRDESVQAEIRRLIVGREAVHQVQFQ
jgi:hypothetical protein